MNMKVAYANFVFLMCYNAVICQNYIGDSCTLQTTSELGQCQLIENCPAAIHAFHADGTYPQNCGFQGRSPIVCCVECPPYSKPGLTYINSALNHGNVDAGRKSQEKCQEYGQLTFVQSSLNMLSGLQYAAACPFPSVEFVPRYVAKAREFPHMAAIGFDDQTKRKIWKCSGSLISDRFVLTAAQCLLHDLYGEPKYVRLGDLILNSDIDEANSQDFDIIERIAHPDYKASLKYNDIALLKLDRAAQFNAYVKPACLNTNSTLTTRQALISGWNKTEDSSDTSQTLYMGKLKYSAYTECNSSYGGELGLKLGIVEKFQICACAEDSCQTDLGGPLQIYNNLEANCTYKLVGITSLPKPCDDPLVPGVYTRVSKYIQWIEDIVWP